MKKKVLVNIEFKDRYTGEVYVAGKTYDMTEERIKEVKEVNPNFIDVIGNAEPAKEEPVAADQGTEEPVEPVEPAEPAKKKASKKDAE